MSKSENSEDSHVNPCENSMEKADKAKQRADKGKQRKIWAFDSEFMMSGKAGAPEDVITVQFSDGQESYVLESSGALKAWLHAHSYVKTLYAFVALCDIGSLREWLGDAAVIAKKRGIQQTGWLKYGGARMHIVDSQPMLSSFGLRRLADCGDMVGVPKLPKPEWLGMRKWQSEREHDDL